MAVDGTDFVIISWNYQANVTYYRILFRDLRSSSEPNEDGPMTVYCLNTTCSYCISNINRVVSCSTLDRHYTFSTSRELDFEQPLSVRVEACDVFAPEACVHRSEWRNYTIPPGGKYFSFAPGFYPQGVRTPRLHFFLVGGGGGGGDRYMLP